MRTTLPAKKPAKKEACKPVGGLPKKRPTKAPFSTPMTDAPNAPTSAPETHPSQPPLHGRVLAINPALIDLAPELATVPMMGAVASHYQASAKPESKQTGQEIAEELRALFASLELLGIRESLKATQQPDGRWKLWDGRHRLLWATQTQQAAVPLEAVTEEEGLSLIEATVIGRRHWTKGQRAYLAVRLHPEVAGNTKGRPGKSDSVGISTTELASRIGVSPDLIGQAVDLYRLFYAPTVGPKTPEAIEAAALRDRYEMCIWAGMGLGAVIAGIGGGKVTKGGRKAASGFHGLDKPLATLSRFGTLFVKWDDEEKAKATTLLITRFKELPPDFKLVLAEALAAADMS